MATKPDSKLKSVVFDHIRNSRLSKRDSNKDEFKPSDIEKLYPSEFGVSIYPEKKAQEDIMSLTTLFIKKENRN